MVSLSWLRAGFSTLRTVHLAAACGQAFFFAPGLIFPAAQRCFNSRDSFLRAAALMRPRRRRRTAGTPAGRPGRPAFLPITSMAAIAVPSLSTSFSAWSFLDRSSVSIFWKFGMAGVSVWNAYSGGIVAEAGGPGGDEAGGNGGSPSCGLPSQGEAQFPALPAAVRAAMGGSVI